jgi:hypothetical protein
MMDQWQTKANHFAAHSKIQNFLSFKGKPYHFKARKKGISMHNVCGNSIVFRTSSWHVCISWPDFNSAPWTCSK